MSDRTVPSFLIPQDGPAIALTLTDTDSGLADQGYTYNELNLSYNQAGVEYGGVYNQNEDIIPLIASAQTTQPMNVFISDIYTNNVPPPPQDHKGMLIGILGLTYPS